MTLLPYECVSYVWTAVRDVNCEPALHILNFVQYNFKLISILSYEPDKTKSPVSFLILLKLSQRLELQTLAGYSTLERVLFKTQ